MTQTVTILDHPLHPPDYLTQAVAALVCSGFECFGRAIVEGLKCGLPVIVPDTPFGRELIQDGYNGYLYNRDDSKDLARKIILLRQTGALPAMKINASKSVENRFSIPSFAQEFINILNPSKS